MIKECINIMSFLSEAWLVNEWTIVLKSMPKTVVPAIIQRISKYPIRVKKTF